MITFAAPFILTLYGDRWAPSIVPLQLLGIYGLLRSVAVNMGSVFKAGGKPNWLTGIALARLAIMGILLYPATRYYGIVGVSAVSAVVSIADFIVSAALTNRIIHGRFSDYVASLWTATLFSVVSALAARWSYVRISGGHGLIGLLTAGMLMVLLYASLVFVFDQEVRRLAMASLSAAQRAGREFMDSQSDSL
jgi:O-antigen/teichoic acid export membrane protein